MNRLAPAIGPRAAVARTVNTTNESSVIVARLLTASAKVHIVSLRSKAPGRKCIRGRIA